MGAAEFLIAAAVLLLLLLLLLLKGERDESARRKRLSGLLRSQAVEKPSASAELVRKARKLMARPESLWSLVAGLLALAAAYFFSLSVVLGAALAAAAVVITWFVAKSIRIKRLRRLFADRFPDAVDNLTRSVQAGVPMEKALAAIGEAYEGELGRRFTLLVRELELGVPFRSAAKTFADQLNMPDVDFFCAVLALNRESGGMLSPMLISLSRTLRERRSVARKLRVMTSETRSAAKVLSLLPLLVLALQFFINPQTLDFLFHDPTGRFVLGCCGGVMAVGIVIINRMSNLGGQ